MAQAVLYQVKDQLGYLTLNKPEEMNTLTSEMVNHLHEICDKQIPQSNVRAILLRAEGRSFCAGGNVSSFLQTSNDNQSDPIATVEAAILNLERAISKLLAISVPVVAAVHGSVAGAGISLMLTADIIIAAHNTKFTAAYTKLGLSPDGGSSYLLPRAIGPRKALELFLTNEVFYADVALQFGLINKVVNEPELLSQATELAKTLANGPTLAFIKAKQLVHASLHNDLSSQYSMERERFIQSFFTQDFMRGVTAFTTKEPPHFEGN